MLEQLVGGPFPQPPSNQAIEQAANSDQLAANQENAPSARSGRFDMTPSDRMQQLEKELRELRAKFAIQEVELSRVQAKAADQLDIALRTIRDQTEAENQRLKAELAEANRRIQQIDTVGGQHNVPQVTQPQPDSDMLDSPAPVFEEIPMDLSNDSTSDDSELDSPYLPPYKQLPTDRNTKPNARRRLFSKDSDDDDDDEPPARCARYDASSPDFFVPPYSPPRYRTPTPPPRARSATPPVPAYESPSPVEIVWKLVPNHCLLVPPETANEVERVQQVMDQLVDEHKRADRRTESIQWNGDDGPQVARNNLLAYLNIPQRTLQHFDELLTALDKGKLLTEEINVLDHLFRFATVGQREVLHQRVTQLILMVHRRINMLPELDNQPLLPFTRVDLEVTRDLPREQVLIRPPATPIVHQSPPPSPLPPSPNQLIPPTAIVHQSPPPSPLPPSPGQLSPPIVPSAQVPQLLVSTNNLPPQYAPLQPAAQNYYQGFPFYFGRTVNVFGPVNRGDAQVRIHQLIHNVNLPTFPQPSEQFRRWLINQGLPFDDEFIWEVRYDLELRRMFLRDGRLNAGEMRFVIDHIPPAFQPNSPHMLALARIARNSYNADQVHALLFCFSRLTSNAIIRMINRM